MIKSNGMKLSEMVRSFDGSEDVEAWLTKVSLVARINNVKDEAALIPLFLEGDALAVFIQMDEGDQKKTDSIKGRLREAFGMNAFSAYREFCNKRWDGEAIDVYVTDLRRLASIAKLKEEMVVRRAFVNGLPPSVAKELRAMPEIEEVDFSKLI